MFIMFKKRAGKKNHFMKRKESVWCRIHHFSTPIGISDGSDNSGASKKQERTMKFADVQTEL